MARNLHNVAVSGLTFLACYVSALQEQRILKHRKTFTQAVASSGANEESPATVPGSQSQVFRIDEKGSVHASHKIVADVAAADNLTLQSDPAHPLVIDVWSAAYHMGFGPFSNYSVGPGSSPSCPYSCHFIGKDHDHAAKADVVMVDAQDGDLPDFDKQPGQIWIAHWWEAPVHSSYKSLQDEKYMQQFDYTCSYRADSTFPLFLMMTDTTGSNWSNVMDKSIRRSFLEKKQQSALMSAWISNCWDEPSGRNELLHGLERHGVSVASYGNCERNRTIEKDLVGMDSGKQKVVESAKYMFLYAAENALCPDYHTEKLYQGFLAGVVPVYLGAETVISWAPENSIIMANKFDSASELAEYLQKVANDEDLYNSFFAWRSKPLPAVVQQKAVQKLDEAWRCNACRFLHVAHPHGTAHAERCQKRHIDPNALHEYEVIHK